MTQLTYKLLARLLLIGGVMAFLAGCHSNEGPEDYSAVTPASGTTKFKSATVQDVAAPIGVQNISAPAQDATRPQLN